MTRAGASQRGIALILVLWLVVLLSLLATGFSAAVRTDARISHAAVAGLRAAALADAAIHRGLATLLHPETADHRRGNGQPLTVRLEGATAVATAWEEAGKVDINTAPPELLAGLVAALGVDADDAPALAAAIVDWRDADDSPLPGGAERADYEAAALPRLPRNGPFRSIQELQGVMGQEAGAMDRGLYEALAPLVTVYSFAPGVDPRYAPAQVLYGLPGVNPVEVEALLRAREAGQDSTLPPPLPALPSAARWLTDRASGVYTIRGTATLPSGAFAGREWVVWLPGTENQNSYRVLEQRTVTAPEPTREAPVHERR